MISLFHSCILLKKDERLCPYKDIYMDGYKSFVCSSPQTENNPSGYQQGKDKQMIVVFPYTLEVVAVVVCSIIIHSMTPAHVSAGEESAREPTSVIHFLGTQGISLRVCGAENPSQGPWEPGALGAALILGGLETAGGALQLPFPSL